MVIKIHIYESNPVYSGVYTPIQYITQNRSISVYTTLYTYMQKVYIPVYSGVYTPVYSTLYNII